MFLDKVIERNPRLIECGFELHRQGLILPDTYVMDLDAIEQNARLMKKEADRYGIELYFMLKQIGRNPLIARKLMEVGFKGAVVVDFKEALCMIEHDIHISNVGHLVQIPEAALKKIVSARPDYVTVYSLDKIKEINEAAKQSGLIQKVLIRLSDDDSELYSGQEGGFDSSELEQVIKAINDLSNIEFGGLTVFPALLYSKEENAIVPTANIKALQRGIKIVEECGLKDFNVNVPSATCCASIPLIHELKGRSGEPGHGLTGTTPLHKYNDEPEIPAYIYVSEISHRFRGNSFCYGGGHYRRGHMENVLIGDDLTNAIKAKVSAPSDESIDYHYEISGEHETGKCAIFSYRTQIFTTRSHVAIVEGLSKGEGRLSGIYSSLGEKIDRTW